MAIKMLLYKNFLTNNHNISTFFGYFASYMKDKVKKKRSLLYKWFKVITIILSIPFFLLWLLIIALYIPPVQRYAVNKACEIASSETGFNIEMEAFHLAFPLTLDIDNFTVSRNDTVFAKGDDLDVNISLTPLLKGEVEINYVSLEKIRIDTHELIDGIKANGEIGHFRVVARNIDFENERVNLRQIHLHSSTLNVILSDTTKQEETESEPLSWVVELRRGTVENCRFNVTFPLDTLSAGVEIGKLRIARTVADIKENIYSVRNFSISNSNIKYDKGVLSREEAPLEHIVINDMNVGCKDIFYSADSTRLHLYKFTLVQPQGIRITNASAVVEADSNRLDVKDFTFKSKNGSHMSISTQIPWSALRENGIEKLKAEISLGLNKRDLGALLTSADMESLSLLQDNMLAANANIDGNVSLLKLKNANIDIPGILELQADGEAGNLLDMNRLQADMNLKGKSSDVRRILGTENLADTTATGIVAFDGKISYMRGDANADINIYNDGGGIVSKARYDLNNDAYSADIEITGLDIESIMPSIPLSNLTMKLKAEGEGTDLLCGQTFYNIAVNIDTLNYDKYRLACLSLNASQENLCSDIEAKSNDEFLKFLIKAKTRLDSTLITNTTTIDLTKADFMMLKFTEAEVGTEMKLKLEASTDMQQSHALKFNGKNIKIITEKRTFTPADIEFDFSTSPDTSYIIASNGDLKIDGAISCGYEGLFKSFEKAGNMYMKSRSSDSALYYLHDYEKILPNIDFNISCGQKNMLYNFLAFNGMHIDNMSLKLKLDTIGGLNMNSGIYGFKSGELNLDTIRAFTRQEGNKIRYLAGLRSTAINPEQEKQTFSATLFGNIFNDSLTTNFTFRDKRESVAVRFGFKTQFLTDELHIKFQPNVTLLNNKFTFGSDNYVNIGKGMSIAANILLTNKNNAGMHLYTNHDPAAKYNANLDLFNVDLGQLTGTLPFAPDISGLLNMNLFYRQSDESMLISSDAKIDSVEYEGTYIGNESMEMLYFPKGDNTHYIDFILNHNGEEVAHMSGDYIDDLNDPGLHGEINLIRFPLDITRAFTKDSGMDLCGYINSNMSATGNFSNLLTNGFVQFDSVYVNAPMLGTNLHLADEEVKIEDNEILFRNFNIYAKGKNPFKVNGSIGLSDITNPAFNLRMTASNYELINAPRKRGAMLYGKMFVDFRSFISGTLNNMKIYGNATLLGKSNITYVMQDAAIETDKELDGLVEFVNFNDSTTVERQEQEFNFGNTNFNFNLKIEDGARINADFDETRNSYITLQGGGNLNITYTDETGMNVIGTYTMSDGEMKYALPIIPLKTFTIADGSKVSWTGDIFDPDINITALEKITTSVSMDDNSMQPVAFNVGVKLSNTLSNMGLSFTISAPENAAVQDHLNTLDEETLNKYAVTMLITGTYIGNSKGMTVSNALSTFLDAKINDLAGSAMKNTSINVGINDAQNSETGGTYKNYSFSFKKKFWNDRITIVIGGEVNSGDHPTGNDSFINNVSLEWKISNSSNRYVRLFYDKNYESLLEGEIIETGVGYIYKRKLDNLNELFIFKKKDERAQIPVRTGGLLRTNVEKKEE